VYFANKKSKLFILGIFVVIAAAGVLLYLLFNNKKGEDFSKKSTPKEQVINGSTVKTKVLKSQEEIWPEYKENIGKLLETIEVMEGDSEAILQKTEAGFLNIFVPNDLREMHINTLLEIQTIDQFEYFKDPEALRSKIIPLLSKLLEQEKNSN